MRMRDVTRWSRGRGLPSAVICIVVIQVWSLRCSSQYVTSENDCDWTVWDTTYQQAVHTVAPRCNAGTVTWHHPYGAVRIKLSASHNAPFITCFMASTLHTTASISLEREFDEKNGDFLERLMVLDRDHPRTAKEMCIVSEKGDPVVLYVEVEVDQASALVGQVEVEYDVERWKKSSSDDPMEACRPCTDAEILRAACSSDFVVEGSIDSVSHMPEDDETEIRLQVSKIIRQAYSIFSLTSNNQEHFSDTLLFNKAQVGNIKTVANNGLDVMQQNNMSNLNKAFYKGSVVAPHRCGVRKGIGDYVFMGKVRLKRGVLRCAPRVEEFRALWKKATDEGNVLCVLN